MNQDVKKLLRTLQVNFSYLLESKFTLTRFYRNKLNIPFEKDFYALQLFPDDQELLFLDVGANRGQSTDAMLMQTKNSNIQMFEPNPLLCKRLERQYANNKRVVIHEFGLGDETTEQFLYTPFYKNWMFDGLASFDKEDAGTWLVDGIFFYKEKHQRLEKTHCQIKLLDDLGLAPFFVKIDVQGYELQALKGAEKTIRQHEPILLIELPNESIMNHLKERNYEAYSFENGTFTPGIRGELNTFFMTNSKASLVEKYIVKV